MPRIDYSMMIKPLPGNVSCGDIAWAKEFNNQLLLCLIDVAGHGRLAQNLAEECIHFLEKKFTSDLKKIILDFHDFLKGTRGLVIGLSLIDTKIGLVKYIGIGNIRTRIIGHQGYRFVSRTGVLGVSKPCPVLEQFLLNDQDVLLMYSDGIIDRFEKKDYPNISIDPVNAIPDKIISMFAKNNDDMSCIAARYFYD